MDYRRKLRLLELVPAPLREVFLARRHRRELERDQNAEVLSRAIADRVPRRQFDYINNFLFVPGGRAIAGIG
ncbi:MAG: hypothetical protein KUG65_11465 [Sphingomonadaceae bacterium]|nr:hypothetical protein [Sphingomonadaceae bacterium]